MALKATKKLQAISKPALTIPVVKVMVKLQLHQRRIPAKSAQHALSTQVVALFPFFQVDLSSTQQQMLHRLTSIPRVMGICGALLGMLPLAVQKWLVNWWGGVLQALGTSPCNVKVDVARPVTSRSGSWPCRWTGRLCSASYCRPAQLPHHQKWVSPWPHGV